MPTEDEARRLLARAAATIEVDESAPMTLTGLPEPRHRRWPVLLGAAAAVVVAIGGGYLVAQRLGDEPVPAPPAVAEDREPVEQEHVYGPDQMPSLLGYTEEEAVELLRERGYPFTVEAEYSCELPKGFVVGTQPAPGVRLGADDAVVLRVTVGPSPAVSCVWLRDSLTPVFALIRFARGLGPTPHLPAGVAVAVGDGTPVEVTGAQAADSDSWMLCGGGACHSPLGALEEMLTRPGVLGVVVTQEPERIGLFGRLCSSDDRGGGAGPDTFLRPTYVYVQELVDGASCPRPVVRIDWTDDLEIASVRLLMPTPQPPPDPTDPTPERRAAAEAFVRWARGDGPAPAFADRVRQVAAGFTPAWNEQPEDRGSWSGCSGLGFPDCGLDPVAVIARYHGDVVATAGPSSCAGPLPARLAAAEGDVVRLGRPEAGTCERAALVQLWIGGSGVIYAVQQTGGVE